MPTDSLCWPSRSQAPSCRPYGRPSTVSRTRRRRTSKILSSFIGVNMNIIKKYSLRFIYLSLIALAAVAANGQDAARLHFEKLNGLDTKARDVVEVNIDGKLLDLA